MMTVEIAIRQDGREPIMGMVPIAHEDSWEHVAQAIGWAIVQVGRVSEGESITEASRAADEAFPEA